MTPENAIELAKRESESEWTKIKERMSWQPVTLDSPPVGRRCRIRGPQMPEVTATRVTPASEFGQVWVLEFGVLQFFEAAAEWREANADDAIHSAAQENMMDAYRTEVHLPGGGLVKDEGI